MTSPYPFPAAPLPPAPPTPPRRPRRILRWVLGGLTVIVGGPLLLLIILGFVGAASSDPTATAPAASASASAPAVSTPAPAPVVVTEPAPTVSAPATAAPGTITNGEWLVGDEVEPGTYRSPGPEGGVIKLAMISVTDASDKIVSVETSNDGPIRVTVTAGQTIKVTGSQPLVRVG